MKLLARLATALFIISVPVFLVTANVRFAAGDSWFTREGFRTYDVDETTGLSFQFEDIFEAADRIEAGGAKIIEPPRQREGEPILLGRFRDREGNEVYMTQHLG